MLEMPWSSRIKTSMRKTLLPTEKGTTKSRFSIIILILTRQQIPLNSSSRWKPKKNWSPEVRLQSYTGRMLNLGTLKRCLFRRGSLTRFLGLSSFLRGRKSRIFLPTWKWSITLLIPYLWKGFSIFLIEKSEKLLRKGLKTMQTASESVFMRFWRCLLNFQIRRP